MVRHETFEAASGAVAELEAAEARRSSLGTIDEEEATDSDSEAAASDAGQPSRTGAEQCILFRLEA